MLLSLFFALFIFIIVGKCDQYHIIGYILIIVISIEDMALNLINYDLNNY